MFTRCPNCHAAFGITDQQMSAAIGMVRCNLCEHVFDARLYLFNESRPNKHQQDQQPLDAPLTSASSEANSESLDKPQHKQTAEGIKAAPPGIIVDQVTELENQASQLQAPRWLGASMRWMGRLTITALVIIISVQIIAVSNVHLIPALQRAQICQWLTCVEPVARALHKIDVLNRSIYSHQTKQNALVATITMVNRAPFSQAYPVIQLRFLNISGEITAARQFGPNHYLHAAWKPENLMAPNIPVSIKLELEDAGKEVISYDFDFL